MTESVLIVGAGVIGAGWAVRFLAFGWKVYVYDPHPQAKSALQEQIGSAREHVTAVYPSAQFDGEVIFVDELEPAVAEVDWIQESLPENLSVKREIYRQLGDTEAVVASSTSGFRPTVLAENTPLEGRLLVCHPFNPVYLLPLVEVVAGAGCSEDAVARAESVLRSIGMYPLKVRKEIDAHIADRLLEAVWREALWLVKDGVATTAEVDAAITYGFGLRWAQMGLFETYRLGGGEGGFEQFLRQFGPALQWPWSRLTDVPELDDELVKTIVTQSDAQSGHMTTKELAQRRDANLVTLLQGLARENWGVGEHLNKINNGT